MNKTKTANVVVVGSYNAGLIAITKRMPVWGETILASGFNEGPGGKGSNQAVTVARLGGNVRFIGCIGLDHYGDDAMLLWQKENIETSFIKRTEFSKTGVGFVFVHGSGENCILVDPGANLQLLPEDVKEASAAIEDCDILLVQLESNLDTIEYAMKLGKQKGKTVILNPAPAIKKIDHLLSLATILTPNESELKILLGVDPSKTITENETIELAKSLLEKGGPKAIVVTRGEKGALVVLPDNIHLVSCPKVNPIDTTGAGDSFNGALAVALGEGNSILESVQFACYVGAFSVTRPEVIPSLPTRVEISVFIKSHRVSIQ